MPDVSSPVQKHCQPKLLLNERQRRPQPLSPLSPRQKVLFFFSFWEGTMSHLPHKHNTNSHAKEVLRERMLSI